MSRLLLALSVTTVAAVAAVAAAPVASPPFDDRKALDLRRQWAREFALDPEFTNSLDAKLALIPGGRFERGPNGSRRRVSLSKPYYLGVTEVTTGQYRKYKPDHKVPDAAEEFN